MSGLGQVAYGSPTGQPLRVAATQPEYKAGGLTIDWANANIAANATAAAITLPDGTVIQPGEKYVRFGTVMQVTVTSNLQNKAIPVVLGATLVKGRVFIMNETVKQSDPYMSDHAGGPFEAGRIYRRRLNTATWTNSAAGTVTPETEANVLAAMPLIQPIDD